VTKNVFLSAGWIIPGYQEPWFLVGYLPVQVYNLNRNIPEEFSDKRVIACNGCTGTLRINLQN